MKDQFDLYFAGYYSENTMNIVLDNDYNQLLSNINERRHIAKYIEAKKSGRWKGKLLIDSGAFSVHRSGKDVPLEEYIEWLNENHEYLDLYIQLDDIPGKWGEVKTEEQKAESPKKTWENYLYMSSKLINHKKLLPVFHQGEDFYYLKQMLEYRDKNGDPIDYICISSNKEMSAKKRYEWYKICYEVIQNSSNPNIKVHSLGTQSENHCESIPFTSVDATSWIMTGANGNIYTKFGVYTVSERQLNRKDNVVNTLSGKVFEDYLKENNVDIEILQKDNNARIEWNLKYLGNWARDKRTYKGPKSFKKGRLF